MRLALPLLVVLALPVRAVVPAALPVAVPHAVPAADGSPAIDVLYERRFSVRPGGTLTVDLSAETVVVETVSGSQASVRVDGRGRDARDEFERRRFTADSRGSDLTVRTRPERTSGWRMGNRQASFTVTIQVPRRYNVSVDVGSGSVRVGSVEGSVTVDTGSGSVSLADVRGERVTVDTGSGSVRAGRLDGDVAVDTGSGSVSLGQVTGKLTVSTGSGSVQVERLDSAEGRLSTGSGSVHVGLRAGAGADLDAEGSRVTIADALRFRGRQVRDEARGQIGAGGPPLRISTGSGGVELAVAR